MDTFSILAQNIYKYRKQNELTQDELAQKLGVTFQAISKWENARSAPDITFLPLLADIFGCSIDDLFSRSNTPRCAISEDISSPPWQDDMVLRGVIFYGKKILKIEDNLTDKFTFELTSVSEIQLNGVHSECNISIDGDVHGNCFSGMNINVEGGDIYGNCNSGVCINLEGGDINGNCTSVSINIEGGDLNGNCISTNIECDGSLRDPV